MSPKLCIMNDTHNQQSAVIVTLQKDVIAHTIKFAYEGDPEGPRFRLPTDTVSLMRLRGLIDSVLEPNLLDPRVVHGDTQRQLTVHANALRQLADRWATDRDYKGSPVDDIRALIGDTAQGSVPALNPKYREALKFAIGHLDMSDQPEYGQLQELVAMTERGEGARNPCAHCDDGKVINENFRTVEPCRHCEDAK